MTKRTKQKIVTFAMVICVLALGAAGTLAYFADQTEYVENTFTIGNVEIELYESQFHRVNAGATTAGRLSHDTADYPMNGAAGTAPDDAYGWTGAFYTDEQILADANTYQTPETGYLAVAGKNMAPGSNVMKCPYVKNVGANDAYVRVRVLIPAVLDNGILSNSMYTQSALDEAATLKVTTDKTVNGKVYNEYAFTYTDPLVKDQLTFWNCWGDIKINDNTTNEQIQALIESGDLVKDANTGAISFGVLVQADAIQADNFADATAAMAAFDAQTAAGN